MEFIGTRSDSQQVERRAAEERCAIRLGRRRDPFLIESRDDEAVERTSHSGGLLHVGNGISPDELERPVIALFGSGRGGDLIGGRLGSVVDPFADQSDLIGAERRSLGRHLRHTLSPRDGLHEQTLRRVTGDDGRPAVASLEHPFRRVDPQPRHLLLRAVTLPTLLRQQRLHASRIDIVRSGLLSEGVHARQQ